MEIAILNITVIVIGLILGSFINVLAYRLPNDMPVILSRSQCPKCNTTIPLYRNIPIITYLLQTGKCHNCNQPISLQYPIIEFLTAIVLLLGFNNDWSNNEYILFIWSSCILITISIIDFKTFTIPLKLIMLFLIGELFFMITAPTNIENMLLGLFLGLGYLGTTFIITSIIYKKQTLGYGDLLLISVIGLWIGPVNILICIFLSSILGITLWVIKSYQKIDNEKLPFGTYLSLNAILLKLININFISYMSL
tara:strand:+ start:1709 stop:2464 length:756 start_codon:yes stop_codon:yes gene_type:complete